MKKPPKVVWMVLFQGNGAMMQAVDQRDAKDMCRTWGERKDFGGPFVPVHYVLAPALAPAAKKGARK